MTQTNRQIAIAAAQMRKLDLWTKKAIKAQLKASGLKQALADLVLNEMYRQRGVSLNRKARQPRSIKCLAQRFAEYKAARIAKIFQEVGFFDKRVIVKFGDSFQPIQIDLGEGEYRGAFKGWRVTDMYPGLVVPRSIDSRNFSILGEIPTYTDNQRRYSWAKGRGYWLNQIEKRD